MIITCSLIRKALRTPGQHTLSSSEEKLLFHERGGDLGSGVPHKDTGDIENGGRQNIFPCAPHLKNTDRVSAVSEGWWWVPQKQQQQRGAVCG